MGSKCRGLRSRLKNNHPVRKRKPMPIDAQADSPEGQADTSGEIEATSRPRAIAKASEVYNIEILSVQVPWGTWTGSI